MGRLNVLLASGALLSVLAVACGGAPRPQPATASGGAVGDPTVSSSSDDEAHGSRAGVTAPQPVATGAAPAPARPKKTVEESHQQFVGECAKTPDLKPYCECAWGVSQKSLSSEEIANDRTDPQKMAQLQSQVLHTCASHLPESAVRSGYLEGCERGEPGMRPYCECLWPELKQRLSIAELATPEAVRTPKFATAVKAGANKCGAKLPEDLVKKSFLTGCTGGKTESDAFCGCAWKELRSRMSLADIQSAGVGDQSQLEQMRANIGKSCGSLKPGAPSTTPAPNAPTQKQPSQGAPR